MIRNCVSHRYHGQAWDGQLEGWARVHISTKSCVNIIVCQVCHRCLVRLVVVLERRAI